MNKVQTKEEMIAVLKEAGIDGAEWLIGVWTYRGRAKNVSQLMRLWIDEVNDKMQQFIIPYKFAVVGIDVYDAHALMGYILKLSQVGVMPSPVKVKKS